MMQTRILRTETAEERFLAIEAAVKTLRSGDLVGLPTETVYGLGADASNEAAVLKIFQAKDRPRFDPLIVHLPSSDAVSRHSERLSSYEQTLLNSLANSFWPGPLTIVLKRNASVSPALTAGLPGVALRISAHPVFSEIIRQFGGAIAAPSANRFGRISPTSAAHVNSELGGSIPLIVDAGCTAHGLESTVISVAGGQIRILRPGPITEEQLVEFAPVTLASPGSVLQSPGQLPSHYAPTTPLLLVPRLASYIPRAGQQAGALAWMDGDRPDYAQIRCLSPSGDLREAAANLFRHLHELDACGLDVIVAEEVPETGLGRAIMDRLRRASAPR